MGSIPPLALPVIHSEELGLFAERGRYVRMTPKILVEGTRPASLTAQDDEIREYSQRCSPEASAEARLYQGSPNPEGQSVLDGIRALVADSLNRHWSFS